MPVILASGKRDLWLDPSLRNLAELLPLPAPYPAGEMILEVVAPQACLV